MAEYCSAVHNHTGDWYGQHDVDILDDHRISVFNNNAAQIWRIIADNDVLIYDFETGEISAPWHDALKKNQVRTVMEGLAQVLPGNDLFVEEQNFGRILRLTEAGDVVWEYVNRARMGRVFRVGWSRLLTAEEAAPMLKSIAQANCSG